MRFSGTEQVSNGPTTVPVLISAVLFIQFTLLLIPRRAHTKGQKRKQTKEEVETKEEVKKNENTYIKALPRKRYQLRTMTNSQVPKKQIQPTTDQIISLTCFETQSCIPT